MKRMNTRTLTGIAMLVSVSFILSFFEFPVPLSPSFAKMDLSDLPCLIGVFAYGPAAGTLIELIKNVLGLFSTQTGGVGELANFLVGAAFVIPAGVIYRWKKSKKTAWIGCLTGSFIMGMGAAAVNYFILLPLFSNFMPLEQVIASFGEFLPFIKTKLDVVLYNAFPFNLLKGLAISLITMLIYKPLSRILKGARKESTL